ncbi:hypothetical protein C3Y87_05045 [Carbonactinospora thermoautotrophica]|uniref:Putative transposase n=1 Tax=Carbonactinospora thermoautotrophica TaxID=1469144 RepID=A0A132ND19_9ACTN|nr:hypothetical protein [Carbonactinospora thermoautotrophica]KWX01614.1 putative transposase [Carbonactinospora thermoautotrophica]KWX07857.1 hypothetical protein TR74_17395 [Carbonactinospora thermoautotrophica]MCX9190787.1 hypothetical protein [Carbonactinospora thermoautotrophica]
MVLVQAWRDLPAAAFFASATGTRTGRVAGSSPARTPAGGPVHDRDVNVAENILAAGRAERLNACGAKTIARGGCRR